MILTASVTKPTDKMSNGRATKRRISLKRRDILLGWKIIGSEAKVVKLLLKTCYR